MKKNDDCIVKFQDGEIIHCLKEDKISEVIKTKRNLPPDVLAVKIDNELHSLNHRVIQNCSCEFVTYSSYEGKRIYSQTLKFVFLMAAKKLYPRLKIRITNKIGRHFYIKFVYGNVGIDFLNSIISQMKEIINADLPIEKEKISYRRIKNIYAEMGSIEQLENFDIKLREHYTIYKCLEYYNYLYGDIATRTGIISGFDFRKHENGYLLMLPDLNDMTTVTEVVEHNSVYNEFEKFYDFAKLIGINNVAKLNAKVLNSEIDYVIRMVEAEQEKRIFELVNEIAVKRKSTKVILISGPSSSGKTTFSQKFALYMRVCGKNPKVIAMDNYFKDAKVSPLDENGNKDFESINHLDIELFKKQMLELISGKEVIIPTYNFLNEGGKKEYHEKNRMILESNDILILEGIHALNPAVSNFIESNEVFKIYVAPLVTIGFDLYTKVSSNDIRLLRRIVRDEQIRGSSIENTFESWEKVRRGEERNIFPFVNSADYIYNTNLLYEVGVLKPFSENLLLKVSETSKWYSEARRLYSMLQNFRNIQTSSIPATSIIKEFIGTGCFYR